MEGKIECNCKKGSTKDFILKSLIVFVFAFILIVIANECLKSTLSEEFLLEEATKEEDYIIHNFNRKGTMVAFGDDGISATPIDAYISNGIIYVKANIKNNTGTSIKFKDYGIVTANYNSTIFGTDYDDEKVINNKEEGEIKFSLGAYDVMSNNKDFPNAITFELGGYNLSNNNYYKYDLKFYISWLYNEHY